MSKLVWTNCYCADLIPLGYHSTMWLQCLPVYVSVAYCMYVSEDSFGGLSVLSLIPESPWLALHFKRMLSPKDIPGFLFPLLLRLSEVLSLQ